MKENMYMLLHKHNTTTTTLLVEAPVAFFYRAFKQIQDKKSYYGL